MWGLGAGIGAAGVAMQQGDTEALNQASRIQENQSRLNAMRQQEIDAQNAAQQAKIAREQAAQSGSMVNSTARMGDQTAPAAAPAQANDPYANEKARHGNYPAPKPAPSNAEATLAAQQKSRAAAQAELDALRNRPQHMKDTEALRGGLAGAADVLPGAAQTVAGAVWSGIANPVARGVQRVANMVTGTDTPMPAPASGTGRSLTAHYDDTPYAKNKAREAELLDQLKFHDDNIAALQKKRAPVVPIGTDQISAFAAQHQVDPRLALAIFGQETNSGKNTNDSAKGAVGPMQIMPGTFDQVKALKLIPPDYDIRNPAQAAEAGVAYLGYLQKTLKTNDPSILAQAYFSGPGGVGQNRSDGRVNTNDYAAQVLARMGVTGQPGQPAQPGAQAQAPTKYDPATGPAVSANDPWRQQLANEQSYAIQRLNQLAQSSALTPAQTQEMQQLRAALPQYRILDFSRQLDTLAANAAHNPDALAQLGATMGQVQGEQMEVRRAGNGFVLVNSKGASVFGQPVDASSLANAIRLSADQGLKSQMIAMRMEVSKAGEMERAKMQPQAEMELMKIAAQGSNMQQLHRLMGNQEFITKLMEARMKQGEVEFKLDSVMGNSAFAMDKTGKGVHISFDPKTNKATSTPITAAQFASVPGKGVSFQDYLATNPMVTGQAPAAPAGVSTSGAGFTGYNMANAHRTGAFQQ